MTDDELHKIAEIVGEPTEIVRHTLDLNPVTDVKATAIAAHVRRHDQAVDAFFDAGGTITDRVGAAITNATTVTVTDELVAAAHDRIDERASSESVEHALRAAFMAAGLMVTS